MIKTPYGKKQTGSSQFVIIAPHAAGDDLKTGVIAKGLAAKLNGFFIINNTYKKATNSKAVKKKEIVSDFNKLTWSTKKGCYVWGKKHPHMKNFFSDINDFCRQARIVSGKQKIVAVYIHGIHSKTIGIDIGAGVKAHNAGNKVFGSKQHREIRDNSGDITVPIGKIKKIKKDLQKNIKVLYNLEITIGTIYSGWSKQSAIQFHRHEGRNDYAIQFEISHILRKKESLSNTINILAETLTNHFS